MSPWAVFEIVGGGYLVGSISPAYLFGRWLKGIDIRTVGRKHAGASNVYLYVNRMAGVATGAFDLAKGVVVVLASRFLMKAPLSIAYLGGFAAVLGHVFPFYLGFRGGRGAACSTGLLVLSLFWLMIREPLHFLPEIVILAFTVATTLIITRSDYLLSLVVLPLLMYFLMACYYPRPEAIASIACSAYLFCVSLFYYVKEEDVSLLFPNNPTFWGSIFNLLLLVFLILTIQYPAWSPYLPPLVLASVCFYLDCVRLRVGDPARHPTLMRLAGFLYHIGEGGRFSATTFFMLGATLTLILFQEPLALAAVSFLIAGDFAEKVIEPLYGRTRFLAGSLEGMLGHLTACVILGYVLHSYLGLPIRVLLVGSVTESLMEPLPFRALNRVIVPLASAGAMFFFSVA